jgi:hypothetical protein
LIHPNVGEIASTMRIISSGSWVLSTKGIASTQPNSLNKIAFPSITGKPAIPQILPNHKTADPSLTIATVFPFRVYAYANSGSLAISLQG